MSPLGTITVPGGDVPVITAPVKVATVSAIALSGTQTIDGVALNVGDRVLVKGQGGAGQGADGANAANGVYNVQAGAWTRALDMGFSDQVSNFGVAADTVVPVLNGGLVNGGTRWRLYTGAWPIALGTTPLGFARIPDASDRGLPAYYWNPGLEFQLTNFADRKLATSDTVPAAASGTMLLAGDIVIPGGRGISAAYMWGGSANPTALTNFWVALVRARDQLLLAVSNNITGAIAAHALVIWNLAYTAPADTACWLGIVWTGGAVTPNFMGSPAPANNTLANWNPPVIASSTAGLTTPASAGTVGTTALAAPAAVAAQGVPFVLLN